MTNLEDIGIFYVRKYTSFLQATQSAFTCSNSTMERLEKGKKYVQS